MFKPSLHQLVVFGNVTSLFHFFGQSTRFVEEPLHLRFIQSTYQWHISDIHSSMSTHVPVLLLCCLAHRLSRRVFHYKHPTISVKIRAECSRGAIGNTSKKALVIPRNRSGVKNSAGASRNWMHLVASSGRVE